MNDSSLPPTMASALYLRLADYNDLPAPDQERLKAQLVACVRRGLQRLNLPDRIVLDGADGLIVIVLDHPEGALDAAEACLRGADGLHLQIGIDHGPTLPVAEGEAVVGMIGDGIGIAGAAAGLSPAGELRLTQAFHDALASRAPARLAVLYRSGSLEGSALYAPGPRSSVQRRSRMLAVAGGFALLALVGALIGRQVMVKPAVLVFDVVPGGQVSVDGERVGEIPDMRRLELPAGKHRVLVRYRDTEPLRLTLNLEPGQMVNVRHDFEPPALVLLDILPGGEVFLDGEPKGTLPGLQSVELEGAEHVLEVRFEDYEPLNIKLTPRPGQQLRVKYRFVEEPPPPDPKAQAGKKKARGKR